MSLVVDCFAGGGGASLGIEMAIGRPVDVAINHDREAIAMHMANHPKTRHLTNNIKRVDPLAATGGQHVALAWFSPDCKHFSRAKGGKPVEKAIRDLAWVVVKWAKAVRPDVICLENVSEFLTWGPLDRRKRPIPERKGETFNLWVEALKRYGYEVEWRQLKACDYGSPTIRKRLFIVARCDGQPIRWPEPTHGPHMDLHPYRTAAECIDWSIPCPSIFGRKKPLKENTLRRIANGIRRFVIEAANPFIVSLTHQGGDRFDDIEEPLSTITAAHRGEKALVTPYLTYVTHNQSGDNMVAEANDPLRTITTAKGGEQVVVTPYLVPRYGEREGQEPRARDLDEPAPTVVPDGNGGSLVQAFLTKFSENSTGQQPEQPIDTVMPGAPRFGVVAAHMAQHNGGWDERGGHEIDDPISTITAKGSQQQVVTSHLSKLYGTTKDGASVEEPAPTVTAGGNHIAEVRALLAPFAVAYYGNEKDGQRLDEPIRTLTTKERFALGIVQLAGALWQIVDIGMRMLSPRELFRCQGFPEDYVIDVVLDGKRLTKETQVKMVGNSVAPQVAAALVRVNVGAVGQQEIWKGYELAAAAGAQ